MKKEENQKKKMGKLEWLLIATTVLELNPISQAIKMIKESTTEGVAVSTFFMILTIGFMWFIHGFQIKSRPLIIGNTVKFLSSLSAIVVYYFIRFF